MLPSKAASKTKEPTTQCSRRRSSHDFFSGADAWSGRRSCGRVLSADGPRSPVRASKTAPQTFGSSVATPKITSIGNRERRQTTTALLRPRSSIVVMLGPLGLLLRVPRLFLAFLHQKVVANHLADDLFGLALRLLLDPVHDRSPVARFARHLQALLPSQPPGSVEPLHPASLVRAQGQPTPPPCAGSA